MNNNNRHYRFSARMACLAVLLFGISAQGRSFRPGMIPNGNVKGCANCHLSAGGGGPRTPFGNDVYAIVKGSSATPFWGPDLAKKDSDGDGFTNGQELGDPEGTGTAYPGVQVSNPGVATSKPVVKPPTVVFTSPVDSITSTPPWSGVLQVDAAANAGVITQVEFLDGSTVLGTVDAEPFSLNVTLNDLGTHSLTAKATDYLGFSTTSVPVQVIVQNPAVPPHFTAITDNGVAVTISWEGGSGPFLLQKKYALADSSWFSVLTTTNSYVTVPKEGDGGFYRLADQTTLSVIPLSVILSGGAQVPPTATTATGAGSLSIEGMELSYHIVFSGLSGNLTATHIHGPASATNTAGVLIPFTGPTAPAGVISGKVTLTAEQLASILAGNTYVNIHTAANPSGEIRGQIVPLRIPVTLSGSGEVPAVISSATGSGWLTLVGSHLLYDIDFAGFASDAVAAHLHGPADATQSGPPIFELSGASGRAGTLEGAQELNPGQLVELLSGLTYINIHTVDHGAGEIRGQVLLQH